MDNPQLKNWQILLISGEEEDYRSIRELLTEARGQAVRVDWAKTYRTGLKKIQRNAYGAILFTCTVEGKTTVEMIRDLVSGGRGIPLICTIQPVQPIMEIEALEAGATLCIQKEGLTAQALERCIQYAIQRKQSERQQESSLRQKAILLESIQDGLFGLDRNWRITYANQPVAGVTGMQPDDLIGANIWEMFPILKGTPIEGCYRKAMDERVMVGFEGQGPYDGQWYSVSVFPSAEGISVSWHDISERRRMEKELEISERRYREIIKHAPTAIYEIDFRTRRFLSVNDSMVELSGYSREELLRMDAFELLYPDSQALFQQRIQAWLSGKLPDETVEYRVRAKDGRTIYAVLDATFTRDENGQPRGAVVIGHDVTVRKQAELVVQERERKYLAIFHTLPFPMVLIRLDNRQIIDANPAWQEMFEVSSSEAAGKTMVELRILPQPEEEERCYQQTRAEGRVRNFEMTYQNRSGRIILTVNHADRVEINGTVCILISLQDITEQRRTEEALRRSEEKFSKAFYSHPSILAIIRLEDGKIIETNPTNQEMFGYTREESIGRTLEELGIFVHPEEQGRIDRIVREQGSIRNLEFELIAKSGEVVTLLVSVEQIELGGEAHILVTGIDITERIRMEKTLSDSNEALKRAQMDLLDEKNRLLAVMEALPVGVAIFNDRGERVQINRAFADIWGAMLPSVGGVEDFAAYQAWWVDSGDVVLPEDWALTKAIQNGATMVGQFIRIQKFDGRQAYVLNSAAPMRDFQGRVVGGVVAIMDITERVEAEKALAESEERFRVALSSLPITVYQLDRDLRYVWIYNPRPDMNVALILGRRDDEIYPSERARPFLQAKQAVIESGQSIQEEIRVSVDGNDKYYLLTLEPIFERSGGVSGLIGASLDITEQKQAEIEQLNTRTEIEVQHRLLEQREQERQAMARDLHDGPIQTLSAIAFHLKMIQDTFPDMAFQVEISQVAMDVRSTVRELREIMNEMRPPSLMHFGLSRVLQLYVLDIIERYPEIEFKKNISEDQNRLSEQATLALFRIFQAAISNILQHAEAKTVWVTYLLDADEFLLEIRDNGKGFASDCEYSKLVRGGHFGLVGMKERAESIGGSFAVTSEPGQGTTVRVKGPLSRKIA